MNSKKTPIKAKTSLVGEMLSKQEKKPEKDIIQRSYYITKDQATAVILKSAMLETEYMGNHSEVVRRALDMYCAEEIKQIREKNNRK